MVEPEPPLKKSKGGGGGVNNNVVQNLDWYLFPASSTSKKCFQVGDIVFLKPKSGKELGERGTVVERTNDDRVMVEFVKERRKEVKMKRLWPVYCSSSSGTTGRDSAHATTTTVTTKVIVTPETSHFRNLCVSQVVQDDSCLEIGCSTGEASAAIHKYTDHWIGFDTSDEMVQQCRETYEHAYKVDALTDPTKARDLVHEVLKRDPTKVIVDIGGNREFEPVLRILSFVFEHYPDANLVIVKSRELAAQMKKSLVSDSRSGKVLEATRWFRETLQTIGHSKVLKHPLKAPLRVVPGSSQPICRYHNYHKDGCTKGTRCDFDHSLCHKCLLKGHIARDCPQNGCS